MTPVFVARALVTLKFERLIRLRLDACDLEMNLADRM